MSDVLEQALAWSEAGQEIATATVVGTWGSSPRPVGSQLVVNADSGFVGSVSGGCIEGAVITEALEVIADGKPRMLEFSIENERAWEVGLTCGGTVRVLLAKGPGRDTLQTMRAMSTDRKPGVLVTDSEAGSQVIVDEGLDAGSLATEVVEEARKALASAQSRFAEKDAPRHFLHVMRPATRMVIVGAVHITQVLAPMAELAGFDVVVVDPRQGFATRERFPDATLVTEWPDDYFETTAPDAATAIVVLAHDPKLDDPALIAALNTGAFYVGALGSRKTHQKRLDRLAEGGVSKGLLDKIHGPIGLNIGGRMASDVAISILAEIVQAWNQSGDG